jgi:hypothetical protein
MSHYWGYSVNWTTFRAPGPGLRVRTTSRRLKPDQGSKWEGALQLFYNICLKMIHTNWEALGTQLWISGPKIVLPPLNYGCSTIFVFTNCLQSCTVEAADPPQPQFGPPDPGFRVRAMSWRSRPEQVDNWEGAL